jgi:hypothetical protein
VAFRVWSSTQSWKETFHPPFDREANVIGCAFILSPSIGTQT